MSSVYHQPVGCYITSAFLSAVQMQPENKSISFWENNIKKLLKLFGLNAPSVVAEESTGSFFLFLHYFFLIYSC